MMTQIDTLLSGWLDRILVAIPSLADESPEFQKNHMGSFIDLIMKVARRPSDCGLVLQCTENSKLHGKQRALKIDYSVLDLAKEYSLLRELVVSGDSEKVSSVILELFEASIASAVESFVNYRKPERVKPLVTELETPSFVGGIHKDLIHFFSQAPFPLALLTGPEHTFTLSNDAYNKFIGTNPNGRPVKAVFSEEEAGEYFGLLDSVYITGVPYVGKNLPFSRRLPDSTLEELFVNVAYHPYRDLNDKIVGILAFVNDVTIEHSSQQRVEISESRLRSIFAHASVGFVITDISNSVIEANPRFSEITGYSNQELLKLPIHELVHSEDRPRETEKLRDLLSGKISNFIIEKRFIKKDLSEVWVRNSVSLVPGRSNQERLIVRVAEDVTAYKEAERLRADVEDKYRNLSESMPQIVWTAKSNGELDYFNRVWFEYSGTTYEENRSSGWVKAVHPDDLHQTITKWENSIKTGEIYENEFRLKSATGQYRWFVVRALPSFDKSGKILAWFGTNTDIHEAKLVTEQLQKAKAEVELEQLKFKAIFADSAASMAVLKGPDFVYEIANPSYLALFNNRNIVGQPFTKALPELVGQAFPSIARRVFETGEVYEDRNAVALLKRTEDGELEERYFDQAYTRMQSSDGSPYGVFIHAIEVTERVLAQRQLEEANERFMNAVDAADMGTWEVNPVTGVAIWSSRTSELFGLSSIHSISVADAIKRIHPEDRARVERSNAEAMDPQSSGKQEIEYRILHDNGETRWVYVAGQAHFGETPEGRRAIRFGGTVLDVTDRIMSEVALRDAKERAEAANAAKSTFLANMSHEIRTPLGAIMGFVSLIKDEHITQSMLANYVSVVERNSTQLLRIIDDILDLSKVEAGMMQIEHIDFSLVELLSDFASFMGFRAREKGVLFTLEAVTPLPDVVRTDPTRLRQILTNVVGNAIKFTENGSVKLSVSFSDSEVAFEVEDTGRGITSDQVENLFQPFAQGDLSTTRKFGGTGLGLVLTRKLSEALGGSFTLKSSVPDVGSVFVAKVKVELGTDTRLVKALGFASQTIKDAGAQQQLKNMRVLLVEDSLDNQELFTIFLSRAGAKIDIASDGKSGAEMALAHEYDVVLMDVQMPIMDGVSAVRYLRKEGYDVPIVALTAHAMKEEKSRCLLAGYTAFLTKPLQRNDLVDLLSKFYR